MFKKIIVLFLLAVGGIFLWLQIPKKEAYMISGYGILFGIFLLILALWFGFEKVEEKQWWE